MLYVIERLVDGTLELLEVDVDMIELKDGQALMFKRLIANHIAPLNVAPLTCVGSVEATGFYPKLIKGVIPKGAADGLSVQSGKLQAWRDPSLPIIEEE